MRHVRKNDQVVVIAGRDKGKQGKVLRVIPDKERVVVSGINRVKRHLKPGRRKIAPAGGIIEMEAPIHISNVLPWCSRCGTGRRVTIRWIGQDGSHHATRRSAVESFAGGAVPERIRKIRVCHKCGQAID